MLVYGDRSRTMSASAAARHGASAIRSALGAWAHDPLDAARTALIAVGMVEQALHDAVHDADTLGAADGATDAVGRAFAAEWVRTQDAPAGAHAELARLVRLDAREQLQAAGTTLERIASGALDLGDPDVQVTTPEGFASYALLPDQYAAAAMAWVGRTVADGACATATVVGVRSIGTTLSAVVATLLRGCGFDVARATVRPVGHPYERTLAAVPAAVAARAAAGSWCLVVDEGPGRSGSSMVAVVDALRRAGAAAERIVLLPAHAGGPGVEASEQVRAVWRTSAQVVVPPSELRWSGLDLDGVLAARSRELLPGTTPDTRIGVEDLAGGGWRRLAFDDPSRWPAVAAAFERPARRCVALDGQAILWRFAGVDAPAVATRWRRPDVRTPRPEHIGTAWGFVGTRWISGQALTAADLDEDVLDAVADQLLGSAGPPISPSELAASVDRLGAAVVHNTAVALGDAAIAAIAPLVARAAAIARSLGQAGSIPASAGDGRTDPHGWVRDTDGRLWKVDGFGPEHDHTLAGVQPLVWDVAGAALAWDLDDRSRNALLARLEVEHPDLVLPGWLRFHELARAAVDLGRWTMSGPGPAAGDAERSAHATAAATATLARLVSAAARG